MTGFSTPILFIIFNRPEVTALSFGEIKKLQPKKLYVSADGPRSNRDHEYELCQLTRTCVVDNITWSCEIKTLFRDKNLGCKLGVSSAINWFFQQEDRGIILEDDCIPNRSFFEFSEELLEKYKDEKSIMHIGGTNFLNTNLSISDSYYFSKICHVWGWATWRRAWELYDIEMTKLDNLLENFNRISANKQIKNYWSRIFTAVKENKINTWDYQWLYSIQINNGLAISPSVNMVSNIGFGSDATHTTLLDKSIANKETKALAIIKHPETINRNIAADEYEMLNSIKSEKIVTLQVKRVLNFLKRSLFIE